MADINIDVSKLTYKKYEIPEGNTGLVDRDGVRTFRLEPGEYGFQQVSRLRFKFEVTTDGLISYSAEQDSFLDGRGTNTLVVNGFSITLDGKKLSHRLLSMLESVQLESDPEHPKWLSPEDFPHALTLIPASGYNFQAGEGVMADFSFDVDMGGHLVVDERFSEFVKVHDGARPRDTLIIEGYPITLDGSALSHELCVAAVGHTFARIHRIILIPAHHGYAVLSSQGVRANFDFGVDVSGHLIVNPRFAGFAKVRGDTLKIEGYQITVDGRALSPLALNLKPQVQGWSAGELLNTLTRELTLIPAEGYTFLVEMRPGTGGTDRSFNITLDIDGTVSVSPSGVLLARPHDPIVVARPSIETRPEISNTPPHLSGVAFADTSHGWTVGFIDNNDGTRIGIIGRTSDGGANWAVVRTKTTVTLRDIAFPDINHGWVVGGEPPTILATADGGATWKPQTESEKFPIKDSKANFKAVAFPDAQNGWVVGEADEVLDGKPSNGGKILATSNGGETWNRQAEEAVHFAIDFRGVAFADAQHGWAVGVASPEGGGLIVATSNGGTTWERQTTPVTTVNREGRGITDKLWGIAFADINHGLAVGENGTILVTADGGRTWISEPSNTDASLSRVAFPDIKRGCAVGAAGVILMTDDGGHTWRPKIPKPDPGQNLGGVAFADTSHGWLVGGNGTILEVLLPTKLAPDLYNSLDRELPLLLLPVRLETRFGERPAITSTGVEVALPVLRLRIYPDDISIDDHQQDLTEGEVTAGRAYWAALVDPASAAEPSLAETQNLREWELLTRLVGTHRATYVAEMTRDPNIEPSRRTIATPATADLLPDRWAVTGWIAGQRVCDALSSRIRHPLAVGPTPRTDGQPIIDPNSKQPLDEGSRWLADYEEAVAAGMAVTIDLVTPDAFAAGQRPLAMTGSIERLFVFGVRPLAEAVTAEREAASLGQLIHRHRAVHGAGFLPQGTPTNNLGDRRTVWSSRPDPYSVAPAPPLGEGTPAVDGVLRGFGTNAQATEAALGLTPGLLSSLEFSGLTEQKYARLMNEALFPVTWGELIGTLFPPSMVEQTDEPVISMLEQARAFMRSQMLDFARARGPLPALRIGKQPYGILPVTERNNWAPQTGESTHLATMSLLLNRMRPFWEFASNLEVSLARELPDLDPATRRLIALLGLGPVPHPARYEVRTVTGELTTMFRSSKPNSALIQLGANVGGGEAVNQLAARTEFSMYRRLLGEIPALPKRSRFYGLEFQEPPDLLLIPIAKTKDPGEPKKEFGPKQYLERLGSAEGLELKKALPGGGDAPRDLLYQLTHRSLRLASEQSIFAAIRKFSGWERFNTKLTRHPVEMYRVAEAAQPSVDATFATPLTELSADLPLESIPETLRNRSVLEIFTNRGLLDQLSGADPPPQAQEFLDTQRAVKELAETQLSDSDYERLVGETLALCATRFDAWQTSIATQRLDLLRRRRPTGLQIGAYGWLLNLPSYEDVRLRRAVSDETLAERSEEDGPLVLPTQQVGFVHAPSLAQAETAAVLRAAELSHGGKAGSSVARLDLTSSRMRTATWVLGAVHNGQPLGAVLGYRLERDMHDHGLSDKVDDIRAAFPQRSAPHPKNPDGPDVQVVPHDVVDGERAWSAWKDADGAINVLGGWAQELGPERADALRTVMRALDGAVEAVADLLVAEGVHQIVSGNGPKAAATLDAVAHGDPPPDFDVLRSPRNGVIVTNRVVLALQDTGPVHGWDATAPRARLAPRLEAWAGRLLGDPSRWVAEVVVGENEAPQPVKLTSVPKLSALDVIHETTTMSGTQSVLAERLIAAVDRPGAHVAQPSRLAAGMLGWDQLVALAGAVRDLIGASRPLTSQDLLPPDAAPLSEPYDLHLMKVNAIGDLEDKGRSLVIVALVTTDLHIRIFDTSGKKVLDKAENELIPGETLNDLRRRLRSTREGSSLSQADKQKIIDSAKSVADHTLSELMPAGEVSRAKTTLNDLMMELEGVTEALGSALGAADMASARVALSKLVPFGVVGAAQPQSLGEASFNERAGAAFAAAARTLSAAKNALALPDGKPDQAPSFGKLLSAARALFGPAIMLTPLLPTTPGLQKSPIPKEARAAAIDEWLTRLGRVRISLANLEDVRMFTAALSLSSLPLQVTQLPLVAEDGWLGGTLHTIQEQIDRLAAVREPTAEQQERLRNLKKLLAAPNPLRSRRLPQQATTHLVLVSHEGLDPSAAFAGLVLDEFSEVIPAESHTTGVGLHYDAPNARPPQSLLLAVHPNPARPDLPWSAPMIENMLIETLALARLRPVELKQQLERTSVDEYLPAIYARDGMENMTPLHSLSIREFEGRPVLATGVAKANLDRLQKLGGIG